MSQLKHRIAIGTITNGEWKHERYATSEEMAELKPKADGSRVEKLRLSIHKAMVDGEFLATRIGIGHGKEIKLYGLWQDVSDTHRVEWGDTFEESGDIYENDILRVSTGDSFIDMIVSFERGTFWLHNIDWTEHETMQDMDGYKPISNTHIYPNFLEAT